MEEDLDKELEQLIKDAMDERDEGDDDAGNTEDESEQDSESGTEQTEEDDTGSSGDGDEDEHQDADEEELKSDFKPIELDIAGIKVTISSEEEMLAYVRKGASTFNKDESKFKEEKMIIEQAGLTPELLKLVAEAKNGSKEALALLARKSNIDILDVENEMADSYKQQTQYQMQTEVDTVANEILSNPELASEFRRLASVVPADFMAEITGNARDLKAFSKHIESGIAKEVIPMAINSQIVNGGTFLENYNKVGLALSQKKAQPEVKREVGQREQELRKRASSGQGNNHQSSSNSGADIWDMSDEDFENLDLSKLK